jgi:predicted nucleic acid-binding protein
VKYFLDTNVISNLVRKDEKAIEKIKDITKDGNYELYINRLVYMESLRAIPLKRESLYIKTKELLDSLTKVDIKEETYFKGVAFARFCKSKGLNFGKCEAIDYLHFMTAKYYGLEMISFDGDMETLESSYTKYIKENK